MLGLFSSFSGTFLNKMKARQEESPNYCIENIGDILIETVSSSELQLCHNSILFWCY